MEPLTHRLSSFAAFIHARWISGGPSTGFAARRYHRHATNTVFFVHTYRSRHALLGYFRLCQFKSQSGTWSSARCGETNRAFSRGLEKEDKAVRVCTCVLATLCLCVRVCVRERESARRKKGKGQNRERRACGGCCMLIVLHQVLWWIRYPAPVGAQFIWLCLAALLFPHKRDNAISGRGKPSAWENGFAERGWTGRRLCRKRV